MLAAAKAWATIPARSSSGVVDEVDTFVSDSGNRETGDDSGWFFADDGGDDEMTGADRLLYELSSVGLRETSSLLVI